MRRLHGITAATTVLLALNFGMALAESADAAGTAWWRVNVTAAPTLLPRTGEAQILLTPTNLGDGTAVGTETNPVVVTDTLPEGMKPVTFAVREGGLERAESSKKCSIAGQTITCTGTGKVAPYAALMTLDVVVEMQEPAEQHLTNSVRVKGGEQEGGASLEPATVEQPLRVEAGAGERTPFGVETFTLAPEGESGEAATLSGSHPYQLTTTLDFNQRLEPDEDRETPGAGRKPGEAGAWPSVSALPRNLHVQLPVGLIGDPNAVQKCTTTQFKVLSNVSTNRCPADTAVGVANVVLFDPWDFLLLHRTVPVFNLETVPGEPARFGFVAERVPVVLKTAVPAGGKYPVEVNVEDISEVVSILSSQVTLWGTPADPRHAASRGWQCLNGPELRAEGLEANCETPSETPTAFLTLPTSCGEAPEAFVSGNSWSGGSEFAEQSFTDTSPTTPIEPMTDCESLPFDPSLTVAPEQHDASTPTGLNVTVQMPQAGLTEPKGRAESALRETTVVLPPGMLLSPAAATALESCSAAEFDFLDQFGHPFGEEGVSEEAQLGNETSPSGASSCSNGAKVGTVSISTPLLSHELQGSVYIARQNTNPFKSPLALYMLAEDPTDGVRVKLAGSVEPDEATGQVSSTFRNTPQLPFTALHLHFFGGGQSEGGERATVSTPPHCGPEATTGTFVPWSGAAPADVESTLEVTAGAKGAPCPGTPLSFSPTFESGPTNPTAAALSPLVTDIGRPDGQQALTGIHVTLPEGFAALISSVTPCTEPPVGVEWECQPSSHIGEVREYSGLGEQPLALTGQAYLTTGYDGAPFGLLVRTLAKAGPFNLGWVNVRARINVNPSTARVSVTSDPGPRGEAIPTMLKGVPVQLKALEVAINRPSFTFNPSSCNGLETIANLEGAEGGTSELTSPFKAQGCSALAFHPTLSATTEGHASILDGASFDVKVTSGGLGVANIAKVDLELPEALPSRLSTDQKACTREVFERTSVPGLDCDKESRIGTGLIHTPILKNALGGPAYLVAHGAHFPDVEFVLQGEGVMIVLDGKTVIKSEPNGSERTYSQFNSTPDAPFTSFEAVLPAGPYSALGADIPNHGDSLCTGVNLEMPTDIVGQNGAYIYTTTKIVPTGCKKKPTTKELLAKALAACRKDRGRGRRERCERAARHRYGRRR